MNTARYACILLLGFGLLLGASFPPEEVSPATHDEPNARHHVESCGWYWVFEGVAHGQKFTAPAANLEGLRVRVAQLNASAPTGPLHIEVRDATLRVTYVAGSIEPDKAARAFAWTDVDVHFRAPLQTGLTYVILFHSAETSHKGPWVVNATYADVYPGGRHLHYPDDLFFSMAFEGGRGIHVGPAADPRVRPFNSGSTRTPSMPSPPAVHPPTGTLQVARHDFKGPIPDSILAGCDGALESARPEELDANPEPSHPDLVLVTSRGASDTSLTMQSHGVRLAPTRVLTVAHAVVGFEAWEVTMLDGCGETVTLRAHVPRIHPEYRSGALDHDLALLTLETGPEAVDLPRLPGQTMYRLGTPLSVAGKKPWATLSAVQGNINVYGGEPRACRRGDSGRPVYLARDNRQLVALVVATAESGRANVPMDIFVPLGGCNFDWLREQLAGKEP